ncbi:MAG: hypothetical protein AAF581_09650 [Planctomycetota bacterium]
MELLAENLGRVFVAVQMDRPDDLVSPFRESDFACLIWDHSGQFTADQRSEVARHLVADGCCRVVCAGVDGEEWHDTIDMEDVMGHIDDAEEECASDSIVTTWHSDLTPEEVVERFVHASDLEEEFDEELDDLADVEHLLDCDGHLILHISDGPARARIDAAIRKCAAAI